MSLKTALLSSDEFEVNEKGILTISDVDNNLDYRILFSCFLQDIELNHPQLGRGRVLDFKDNKWICDFDNSSALQEVKTKTILNYLS